MRVRRDDLVTFHVDGTHGSAVAGLTECRIQPRAATPKPVWNPDMPQAIDFYDAWQLVPPTRELRQRLQGRSGSCSSATSYDDTPFPWDLVAGAKGVQLAERGLKSWAERRWVDIPRARDLWPADDRRRCASRSPTARSRAGYTLRAAAPWPQARGAAVVQPRRVLRRARRRRSARRASIRALDAAIDWDATLAYRRHLWSLGLGVAEAMDTAQRGMGLDWPTSLRADRAQRSTRRATFPAR